MKKRFKIEGMTCAGCVQTVKNAVEKLPEISSVNINLNNKKMDVNSDKEINIDNIINAVKQAGYKASLITDLKEISLQIKGITCSNCVKTIEKKLIEAAGIASVKVNIVTNLANVKYNPEIISITKIKDLISDAGYSVEKINDYKSTFKEDNLKTIEKTKRFKLLISIIFTAILLVVAMGEMLGLTLPDIINPDTNPINFALLQLILIIPPVLSGINFYTKGYLMLWKRTPNMDSLIAIGTSAAIIYSVYAIVQIIITNEMQHLYFETAATIITLILLGKYLENLAKGKSSSAIKELLNLTPDKAILLDGDKEKEILVEEIKLGDKLLVKPGSKVPIDGKIIKGTTSVDESMITGESLPVNKDLDDMVIGGSINNSGVIIIEARRVGDDTTLAKIVKLVEEAEMSKAPIAKLADIISGYFVPTIIIIAIISTLIWLIVGKSIVFSLAIGITVLVIACPCALGLATPTSIIVGTGLAARNGILFKNGETIENAHKVNAIVFDKTGTLTENKPKVDNIKALDIERDKLLALVGSAEKNSNHPLAKAIVKFTEAENTKFLKLSNINETPGKGIEFKYNKKIYYLGSQKYLQENDISFKNVKINNLNKSIIFLGSNKKVLGYITIVDKVKNNAKKMIDQINELGIETHILSGDNYEATAMVAKNLNIKNIHANVLPEDKYKEIKKLQKLGNKVAMVGDGINDSIALKQADIGISLSSSTDVAITSADIVLMKDNLMDIVKSFEMSKKIIRNIKQNLFWAFGYNVLGIPLAAGVFYAFGGPLLNPMFAAAAMSFSSISVVLNSLRIKSFKFK
ncbi:MAG: heavy metal translocating P-type ATPase [Bacillota bacterium]